MVNSGKPNLVVTMVRTGLPACSSKGSSDSEPVLGLVREGTDLKPSTLVPFGRSRLDRVNDIHGRIMYMQNICRIEESSAYFIIFQHTVFTPTCIMYESYESDHEHLEDLPG
jgi:hypothetical protein